MHHRHGQYIQTKNSKLHEKDVLYFHSSHNVALNIKYSLAKETNKKKCSA